MKDLTLVSIDLAKKVFQIHGVDSKGQAVLRKKLKRDQVLPFFEGLPKGLKVAMEGSCGAHYWARSLNEMGLDAGLIPAHKVKPFLLSQKNDKNDAAAIAEAAQRSAIKRINPKTTEQLTLQSYLRSRSLIQKSRVQLSNHIRGLCLEFGVAIEKGVGDFVQQLKLAIEDASNDLTTEMRDLATTLMGTFNTLLEQEKGLTKKIECFAKSNEQCVRLMEIPGVGPIVATAFLASIGDGTDFKNGRSVAANLGLIPRQFSSGGQVKLGRISKRGDTDLRTLLVHGARAAMSAAMTKKYPSDYQMRLRQKIDKKGWGRAIVAEANRMCRVMWHLLRYDEVYKPV